MTTAPKRARVTFTRLLQRASDPTITEDELISFLWMSTKVWDRSKDSLSRLIQFLVDHARETHSDTRVVHTATTVLHRHGISCMKLLWPVTNERDVTDAIQTYVDFCRERVWNRSISRKDQAAVEEFLSDVWSECLHHPEHSIPLEHVEAALLSPHGSLTMDNYTMCRQVPRIHTLLCEELNLDMWPLHEAAWKIFPVVSGGMIMLGEEEARTLKSRLQAVEELIREDIHRALLAAGRAIVTGPWHDIAALQLVLLSKATTLMDDVLRGGWKPSDRRKIPARS